MATRQWTPQVRAGQIIAFSVSLDGLCELFLDNPALVGNLRRLQFNKYLGVVHDASIYDPLGVVQDGLHRFSRPPPEDIEVTLIGAGPTPELPAVGIPINSMTPQIRSSSSSSLQTLEPTALPFNPAFAHIHKPIRLISHDVYASTGRSDDRGSCLSPDSQTRLADAVWQTEGSWEASAPTNGNNATLDNPAALTNINVLVDVWTEIDQSCSFADPSCLQSELAQIQQTIARFYCPPCDTPASESLSTSEEPTQPTATPSAPSSGEPGTIYVLGLSAAITAGVFWTRYLRR
ncbi:hypothetical protein FRC01_003005 [Tulasnella sp. 417]|nr:hypothetical protein FRC01_003005 [Tulasnella sp. 417]